jgi:DNA invertase Pin-like site-specific DNA recombinase
MVARPVSVAIYTRISHDSEGLGLGVARQLADCSRLAEQLGWAVGEEYRDNDVSAYSGKRRPAYERMLADVRDGMRDGVLCYHPDRLTRRPMDFETFAATMDAAGVRHVRFVAGDMDLGTSDGLLIGRIMAAVAANESATKSRRMKRRNDQKAAAGLPHGGYHRPFGYNQDRMTLNKAEAKVVRQVVDRYLAGESLRSLCVWLDERGVRTVSGGPWRSPTLRGLLRSGRIAGLREHRKEVVGPAQWPAIISVAERDRVLARMDQQTVTGRRAPRAYLLSGLCRCGKCGTKLYSSRREDRRRYVCLSGPDHGGCGRLTVVAPPLEEVVADAVLYRLDSKELAKALRGRHAASTDATALSDSLAEDQAQLEDLSTMFAKREITAREWSAARPVIEKRIRETRRALERLTDTDALSGLPGTGEQLRDQWASLNLTRQHAIIAAVVDHIVIEAGKSGARDLDPARVRIIWRV